MANQFVDLPVPVGNGVGAAVDVSTFGASKSVAVGGNAQAQITIEVNNDAGQAGGWAALKTIQNAGEFVVNVACRWMRVRVSNYNVHVGGQANVDVGGTDDGTLFQALAVTAGNGVGAASNTAALGLFKTVQVGGAYRGTTVVEVSEDGNSWGQPVAFGSQSGGIKSLVIAAEFMRVRRVGVPKIDPGLPVVTIGATDLGGGGGGGGLDVDRDGVLVVAAATTLNFIGTRVIDAGGNQADITPAVIFDSAVGTPDVNIRSARLTNQSPIDNTKIQITNLGSADGNNDPTATGATGDGSTIGGGDDNTASGDYSTVPGGAGNIASGYGAVAMGDFAQSEGYASVAESNAWAQGDISHAEGSGQTTVAATFGHAEGQSSVASAVAAHAEGRVNSASGLGAHAEGYRINGDPSGFPNSVASGIGAHCEGSNGLASGDASHVEGEGNIASGKGAHAEGGVFHTGAGGATNTASGVSSHARGNFSEALGDVSTASGMGAYATRKTQDAYASGGGSAGQSPQRSQLVFRGVTPGVAPAEAIELGFGYDATLAASRGLTLVDDHAYLVRVSASVGGMQGATPVMRAFTLDFCVRRAAGVSVIAGTLGGITGGDVTTADWTFVATIGVGPDRIVFTFTTGAVTSECTVGAHVEFIEVLF